MTLPLLTLPHDWAEPVRRTVRYPVAVLPRRDGSEQRVLRATAPVRVVTYRHTALSVADAGRLRALLWEAGGDGGNLRARVPRWEDAVRLAADVAADDTTLPVASGALDDRAFAEGDEVLLWRPLADGTHVWETATVLALASDTVTLFAGVAAAWAAGSVLVPVSAGRLVPEPALRRLQPPYTTATLSYELDDRDLAGVGPVGGTGGTEAAGVPATITLRRSSGTGLATAGQAGAEGWAAVEALVEDATGLALTEQAIVWTIGGFSGMATDTVAATPDPHVAIVTGTVSTAGGSGSLTVTATLGEGEDAVSDSLVVTFD